MLKYSEGFRRVRRLIWLVLAIFVLMGYSVQNVAGNGCCHMSLRPCTTVTTPSVILQNGTAGTSTIYTNSTSAKVNVGTPLFDYVDNSDSNVDGSGDKGWHSNFTAQQYGPDSIYDTLTESGGIIVDYVDNISDVDNSSDVGTHSNFENQKAKDSTYDTLTEAGGGGGGWLSGWAKRVKITVNSTDIDEALTNFSVLIFLSNSYAGENDEDVSFVFDELQNDNNRKKIAVTKSDGTTQCYVEIEKWDDASEQAWLWVKVPSISNTADTNLYLYYDITQSDNTVYVGDTNSTAAENVWDTDFKVVHHFEGTSGSEPDSTSNDNDATVTGATRDATGKIGPCHDLDGDDDRLLIPNSASLDVGNQFTAEEWVKWEGSTPSRHRIWDRKTVYNGDNGWAIGLATDDTDYHIFGSGGTYTDQPIVDSWTAGEWHYVVTIFNGTTARTYSDGSFKDDVTIDSVVDNDLDLLLGEYGGGSGYNWDGKFDEFRLSDSIRSAAWIKATYESGRDHLVDFGSEETPARVDLEVQWTNVIDFLSIERLCIYAGTLGDEDLRVDNWNGTGWENIATDLTANSWNNYTVSLTSATFTIRFKGGNETTGDTIQDQWQIDASLLRVEGAGNKEDAVDQQSNVDGPADIGTHSNFTALQYGPDSINDTLTEEDTKEPTSPSDNNVDSETITHGSTTGISGAQTTDGTTENMTEGTTTGGTIGKVGTDTSGTGTSLTLSFSHTLVAGTNRLVVIFIGIENGNTIDVNTVTYGGVTATKAVDWITGTTGFRYLTEIWYVLENDLPSDGSKTVQITCSGTASSLEINGYCAEYTGVTQDEPEATDGDNTTSSPVTNNFSPSDDAWVMSVAGSGNAPNDPTHSSPQVELIDFQDSSSRFTCAELRGASGETSFSTSFTGTINRLCRVCASWTKAPVYQLDIEHIVNSIGNYENYDLTTRAYRTAENFYLQLYNFTYSQWVNMSTVTASSLTWYNITFVKAHFVNATDHTRIRYWQGVDATQEILYVDYSGVCGWNATANYELDLEIQWTDVPYLLTDEELCIYTGTMGTEDLKVDVWNGTGWENIFNDLNETGWNNASITDWLTTSNFTIRFKGGSETGDPSQDTWDVDVALIHIWNSADYKLDLEVQWTNVDYDETNEELCIKTGTSSGSEDLQVKVRSGGSWVWVMNLTANQWNNVSITSYLTGSTFTIQFLGGTETNDTNQDDWNIDANLLHVWTEDYDYDYVLRVNNTVTDSWQIRLKKYADSNITRLQNCTIYFHNSTNGTSGQIYIENGAYNQTFGPWYDLTSLATIYIAIKAEADSPGTSNIYAYLEILTPGTSTYAQYVITFEIT